MEENTPSPASPPLPPSSSLPPPLTQPPQSVSPLLKPWVIVIGIFVVGVVGTYLYFELFGEKTFTEVISAEWREARESFFVDRNYQAAIDRVDALQDEASQAGLREEASVKLKRASLRLRTDHVESMRLFVEVFNNGAYDRDQRAEALQSAIWHVSSHIDDGRPPGANTVVPDAAFARQHVFGSGRFDILPEGTPLETSTDVKKASVIGFELSHSMRPSYVSLIAASRYYSAYMDISSERKSADEEYIEKMKDAHDRALPLLQAAKDASITSGTYSVDVAYALNSRAKGPMFHLALLERVEPVEAYQAAQDVIDYTSKFRENGEFTGGVFQAGISFSYACWIALLEPRPLAESHTQKIKSLLENLYSLPDEDLRNRGPINSLSKKPENLCYEPTVYIATEVDPRLRDVLLNKIGGWGEEQFN